VGRGDAAAITFVSCWECSNQVAADSLGAGGDQKRFRNAPGAGDFNPTPLLRPGHYVQAATDTAAGVPRFVLSLTTDAGATWRPVATLPANPWGLAQVSGTADDPVLYQAVRRAGANRYELVRIEGVHRAGGATMRDAQGAGFLAAVGSIGLLPLEFFWYPVYAVDPQDPDRVMMVDADAQTVMATADGGSNWAEVPGLAAALTRGGRLSFMRDGWPIVSHVAYDPTFRCHALVGTVEGGIYQTRDRGASWRRVPGSEKITNVSSFYFTPNGYVYVSSWGRGLWRLQTDRRCGGGAPDPEPVSYRRGLAEYTDLATGRTDRVNPADWELCASCEWFAVHGGSIEGVELEGRRVAGVSLSGGVLRRYDARRAEMPATTPTAYGPLRPATLLRAREVDTAPTELAARVESLLASGPPVRALVVRGGELVGLVRSVHNLPLTPGRVPSLVLASENMAGGQVLAGAGDEVTVRGSGFTPTREGAEPVALLVDGVTVATGVQVADDGTFRAVIVAPQGLGRHTVAADQRHGERHDQETVSLNVVPQDRFEERPPRARPPR
jgi:hypothetical protein